MTVLAACPICDEPLTMDTFRLIDDGPVVMVVLDERGTAWPHLRDEHPEHFAAAVTRQQQANAGGFPWYQQMPRNVDGTILHAGQAVGDLR